MFCINLFGTGSSDPASAGKHFPPIHPIAPKWPVAGRIGTEGIGKFIPAGKSLAPRGYGGKVLGPVYEARSISNIGLNTTTQTIAARAIAA